MSGSIGNKGSGQKARPWEWMRRYRMWSANRNVFVYPENYVEPESRDDKAATPAKEDGGSPP